MRYGVCLGVDDIEGVELCANAGFDYVECGFFNLSTFDDEKFNAFKSALEKNNIKCESANGFIPYSLPLSGDEYNEKALVEYIENGMKRGAEIGMKTVVLGSGKARRIPDNLSYRECFEQLIKVLKNIISPIAEKYGITVVIEPLRMAECNIINTVKEGVLLAASTGKENISGLADIFHMVESGDTYDDIRQLKGSVEHAHISFPSLEDHSRFYPKDINEFDYRGYIDALEYAGCKRCSIEAKIIDKKTDIFSSAKVIEQLR